ncbi:Zinc finger MIZ-type [Penicillium frequentans]|uniref:Zinc finger MIZ-type n=1 Tax=Penicillium frequentans TaxID=3151616 RepID=A0AAD6D279_9EURO|nr:Zinc finger MIZ-type [Penicillium glabrum]
MLKSPTPLRISFLGGVRRNWMADARPASTHHVPPSPPKTTTAPPVSERPEVAPMSPVTPGGMLQSALPPAVTAVTAVAVTAPKKPDPPTTALPFPVPSADSHPSPVISHPSTASPAISAAPPVAIPRAHPQPITPISVTNETGPRLPHQPGMSQVSQDALGITVAPSSSLTRTDARPGPMHEVHVHEANATPISNGPGPTPDQSTWKKWQAWVGQLGRKATSSRSSIAVARVQLLYEACAKRDLFYLVLHQIFCRVSLGDKVFLDLPVLSSEWCQRGIGRISELLEPNHKLSKEILVLFAQFPVTPEEMNAQVWYHQNIQEVANFLPLLATRFTSCTCQFYADVVHRRFPPLVHEMRREFNLNSPAFMSVIFASMGRQLYDAPNFEALNGLFHKNQDLDPNMNGLDKESHHQLIDAYRSIPMRDSPLQPASLPSPQVPATAPISQSPRPEVTRPYSRSQPSSASPRPTLLSHPRHQSAQPSNGTQGSPNIQDRQSPAMQSPAFQSPAVQSPAIQSPAVQSPAIQSPTIQSPAVESPAVQSPAVQSPAVPSPATQTPVIRSPASQHPANRPPPPPIVTRPSGHSTYQYPSQQRPQIRQSRPLMAQQEIAATLQANQACPIPHWQMGLPPRPGHVPGYTWQLAPNPQTQAQAQEFLRSYIPPSAYTSPSPLSAQQNVSSPGVTSDGQRRESEVPLQTYQAYLRNQPIASPHQVHSPISRSPQTYTPQNHTPQTQTRQSHTPQNHTPQNHTPQMHTPQMHTPQMHTPQMHTPRPPSPAPLLPPPGYRLPQTAPPNPMRLGLHQADLRDPIKKCIKKGPGGEMREAELYHYVSHFALEPSVVDPEGYNYVWNFSVSADDMTRHPRPVETSVKEGHRRILTYQSGCRTFRLRCVALPASQTAKTKTLWHTAPTTWPSVFYIHLNGREFTPRRKIHNGKDLPLDITLDLQQGENKLQVDLLLGPDECKNIRYYFGIEIMDVSRFDLVRSLVRALPADVVRQKIQKRLNKTTEDDDVAVVTNNLTVSLIDPFTAQVCHTPARSSYCDHQECFDLETFIKTRKSVSGPTPMNDNWRCPICNSDARPQLLLLDRFLEDVRMQLIQRNQLEGAQSIQIKPDGTWTVKATKDEAGPTKEKSRLPSAKRKADDLEIPSGNAASRVKHENTQSPGNQPPERMPSGSQPPERIVIEIDD